MRSKRHTLVLSRPPPPSPTPPESEEPSQTKNVMNVLFSFPSCATNEDPNFSYFLRNLYDTQMCAQTELAIARKPSKFFNSIQIDIDASSIVSFFRFFFFIPLKPLLQYVFFQRFGTSHLYLLERFKEIRLDFLDYYVKII